MCHKSCIVFGKQNLKQNEIKNKKVIEVGAYNVNGSLRQTIKKLNPKKYIGVDIQKGPEVDIVCNADNLIKKFGKNSFDIVISTEMLEHVENWQKVISNLKNICKPNGIILLTTRSKDFFYHGFPYDFWRYEIEDIKNIFSDFEILINKKDNQDPGVFVKIKKPENFKENNLKNYKLYNIVYNKKAKKFSYNIFNRIYILYLMILRKFKNLFIKIKGKLS